VETPVIVITGAGKGYGRAIAEELCRRKGGALGRPKLALISRTASELDSLAATVRAAGLEVLTRTLDITEVGQLPALVEAIETQLGPIDILINNAGVGRFGDFLELTVDDVDFVLATNLRATFVLTQEVFRRMAPRRTGQLVFVTSVAAIQPYERSAVYCMSKFGQRGLAQVVRLHARKANIRVMEVLPGATLTPMWGDVPADQAKKMMVADDIARAIVDAMSLPARSSLEELVLRPVAGDL
jgi:sepiapterin reductase